MASIFNNLRSFAHGAIPGFGAAFFAPPEIKAPTKRDMKEALAYVDALKSVGQWNINNYNPSWLVTRKGLQIFDQMKRDEQIKAALKFKKDSVLAPGWEITSPGDQEEDWEVTRFVKDSLDQMSGGWNQVLVNVLSALDFGYSVNERVYSEQEIGEWKGKLVLTRVQSLKPHYIDFLSDAFGQLQGITQQGIAGAAEPLPPAKFIIYSHAMEFGNFYGVSDLEAAYRPYWTKDNAYKWLAVTLERYGMAPLFALYDPNSYSGGSVEELKKVVKGMQNATMGVIPRATPDALEFWNQDLNKGSSELFLKALERFDQHIARALLVPGMIGMSADEGKTGSLARSSSHQDSFMMVVTQLQNSLASSVMNAQVIPQLCDLNFPKLQSYPQFKFMQFTDEQRIEVLNTWAGMVGGKIVNKIEDDETHVRKILGFPENDDPKVIEETPPPMPGIGVGPDGKPIKMGPDGQPLKLGPDGRPWKDPNAKLLSGKKPNPFEKKFEQDEDASEYHLPGGHDQDSHGNDLGERIAASLDEADKAHTSRQKRIDSALSEFDDGYVIKHRKKLWSKQTIAGDVFWTDGKKFLSGRQLLEEIGGNALVPHIGEKLIYSIQGKQDVGDDIPVEIPEAELSEEMRTFAAAHDAVWVEADGQRVAVPLSVAEFEQDDKGNEGKWVTVRGRAIFIKEGEDLDSALARSGSTDDDPSETKVTMSGWRTEGKTKDGKDVEYGKLRPITRGQGVYWYLKAGGKEQRFKAGRGSSGMTPETKLQAAVEKLGLKFKTPGPVAKYHLPGGHDQDTHGNDKKTGFEKIINGRKIFVPLPKEEDGNFIVYHGSKKRVMDLIKKHGIIPPEGSEIWSDVLKKNVPAVFVTTDYDTALGYATGPGSQKGGFTPIIVTISVPKKEWSKFLLQGETGRNYIRVGSIPPEWLKSISDRKGNIYSNADVVACYTVILIYPPAGFDLATVKPYTSAVCRV